MIFFFIRKMNGGMCRRRIKSDATFPWLARDGFHEPSKKVGKGVLSVQ
jgi:hypothetical protein